MIIKRLQDVIFAIVNPRFWFSNEPASGLVDVVINKIIDDDLITQIGAYVASTESGVAVWISNYPYSYGNLYSASDLLPYRRTRKRLHDYIKEKNRKEETKRIELEIEKLHGNKQP